MLQNFIGRLSVLLLVGTLSYAASEKVTTLSIPPEKAFFKPGPGSEIANAQCLMCHSADYITTQPPTLSRTTWKAIVLKMKNTYGAPIVDVQVEPLVEYLAKHYGEERAKN
jgi:hypothetical protein